MSIEPPPTAGTPPQLQPVRKSLVVLMILLAFGVFLAAVALLGLRSIRVSEPTSVLVVDATEAFKGANIRIEGLGMMQAFEATLPTKHGYRAPFFLHRGSYTVIITHDGQELINTTFILNEGEGRRFDLRPLEALLTNRTTQP